MGDELRNLTFRNPFKLAGGLAPGALIAEDAVVSEVRRIAGAASFRVRAKFSQAGVLRVVLLRHDQSTEIADPAAQSVAIVADTLATIEFTGLIGETYVLIEFTAGSGIPEDAEVDSVEVYTSPNSDAGGVALLAGEAHVGEVGGSLVVNRDNFDALAAGDYAANDVIAADANTTATTPLRGITVARVAGGAGYLVAARATNEVAAWAAGVRLDLYTVAAPTTALTGDNVASAPKFANDPQYVGSIEFATMASPTGSDLRRGNRDDIRIPFQCATGDAKLYYRVVTLAAETGEVAGMQWNVMLAAEAY